jgi:hypothetical protein
MFKAGAGALALFLATLACESAPTVPEALLIDLFPFQFTIAAGSSYTPMVEVIRKNGTVVSPRPLLDWESRAPAVVSVDSTGRIRALKAGATWVIVRVRAQPTVADSVEVIVAQPV